MHKVLVAGAGKIGRLIACLLAESGAFEVTLTDIYPIDPHVLGSQQSNIKIIQCDITDKSRFAKNIKDFNLEAVISALPFYCNVSIAEMAQEKGLHYFDLTEDVSVGQKIESLAQGAKTAFVSQCGVAPGYISIVTRALMNRFESVDSVLMRVGALPENPNNALKYSLTWSTEGLINQCCNPCYGISKGVEAVFQPLEALETIEIDGLLYEAFNTSGGLGTLGKTSLGKVRTMNYKALRYPGHCEKMRFLLNDMKLSEDRDALKKILERALPQTHQDVVVIYVAVQGTQGGEPMEEIYVKKIYPKMIADRLWTAIQVTTASSVCAVVDHVFDRPEKYKGFVLQESFHLDDITKNRFGSCYA